MTDYYQYLQQWLRSRGCADDFALFKRMLAYWQKSPYSVEEFYAEVEPVLQGDAHLNEGLRKWIPEKFARVALKLLPMVNVILWFVILSHYLVRFIMGSYNRFIADKMIERAEKARIQQIEVERIALESQLASPLFSLPREIRDNIWAMVTTNNVIHISRGVGNQPKRRSRAIWRKKYHFHLCVSGKGYDSVACPPGVGDHALCSTSGNSTYGTWRAVCRQMSYEMADFREGVLSKNALQFADLETAEHFLFGLNEKNRSSITHLRLALPYSVSHVPASSPWHSQGSPWQAICNYFSNPWERETLRMSNEKPRELKMPVYFYHSSCYYEHNSDRLYKRWQVGRGDTSWDIGISDMVYKGCPRIDLAIAEPTQEEVERDEEAGHNPVFTTYWTAQPWIQPLLQFRNYDGLTFKHYSPDNDAPSAVKLSDEEANLWEKGVEDLKDHLRGGPKGVQGPQICAFFSGSPYGSGNGRYLYDR